MLLSTTTMSAIQLFKIHGSTIIDSLSHDVISTLLESSKKYMNYVTWEQQHQFYDSSDDEIKIMTFQEILQQEYHDNVDNALDEYLVGMFYNTTPQDYDRWQRETSETTTTTATDNATVEQWLFFMKKFVMELDWDDLKTCLGLEISLK